MGKQKHIQKGVMKTKTSVSLTEQLPLHFAQYHGISMFFGRSLNLFHTHDRYIFFLITYNFKRIITNEKLWNINLPSLFFISFSAVRWKNKEKLYFREYWIKCQNTCYYTMKSNTFNLLVRKKLLEVLKLT